MTTTRRTTSALCRRLVLLMLLLVVDAKPKRPSWLPRFGKQAAAVVEEPLSSSYYFSWTTFGFTHDGLPFLGSYFWIPALVLLGLGVVLAFLGYRLGAWDRPPFVLRPAGLAWSSTDGYWQPPQSHNKHDTVLYAILATTTDPRYGYVVESLLPATHAAVAAVVPVTALTDVAARYGSTTTRVTSDKDSNSSTALTIAQPLSVALYFDDPHVTAAPRWALGWLVAASSHAQAKGWARAASRLLNHSDTTTTTTGKQHKSNSGKHKKSNGPNQRGNTATAATTTTHHPLHHPLHAVRLGPGPILSARIPWRHVLTPVLASWLHWPRGFCRYHEEFPQAVHSPVAAEFFVAGNDDKSHSHGNAWMDYVLFTGDISHTWQDCGYEAPPSVGKSL